MLRQTPFAAKFAALFAALLSAHAGGAVAQEQMLYFRDGMRVDPVEVSRILARPPLTRSIRLLPAPAGAEAGGAAVAFTSPVASPIVSPVALASVEQPPQRQEPDSVALPVQFAFDSADILPKARTKLDALAEGIKLLPASSHVLIEGHTDAFGSPEYNLQLSRKRAEAVKRYLVQEHGLDPQRLRTVGFGKERPIDGLDASGSENRRVQFRGA